MHKFDRTSLHMLHLSMGNAQNSFNNIHRIIHCLLSISQRDVLLSITSLTDDRCHCCLLFILLLYMKFTMNFFVVKEQWAPF